jgi:hypothetical protein
MLLEDAAAMRRREANLALLSSAALAVMPGGAARGAELMVLSDLLRAAYGVNRPSGDRNRALLAAHHGGGRLCRDGRWRMAL